MNIKKILLCFVALLSMSGCHETSEAEEGRVTYEFDVSFYGSRSVPFNNKYMMTCDISYIRLNGEYIDFSQYNISKETLVAGEKICLEMNEKAEYWSTSVWWQNSLYITGTLYNAYVKPASLVELEIQQKENEVILVDENHSDMTYSLLDAEYSNGRFDEKISPVFHSLLGGEDYTLLEEIDEGTKVYGTYLNENCEENMCTLSALYSFNPYE